MDRRTFLAATAMPLALAATRSVALAAPSGAADGEFAKAEKRFKALPGKKAFKIAWGTDAARDYLPDDELFVGSAIKTFILAEFLREVEAGRLSEDELLAIDDGIRSLSSPVFGAYAEGEKNLAGMASARTVLEAMISHSDNTATDAALRRVGVGKVRAFITETVKLKRTRIPDSTRRMFSYLAGAPAGVDLGWAGMKEILANDDIDGARPAINDRETMISTASELVSYYRRALDGTFFTKKETLTEFKRIQAMADLIARVVPANTAAYAKGGSVEWLDFHAVCAPGQMVVRRMPFTFCFTLNWKGPDSGFAEVLAGFGGAVAGMLAALAKANV